MHCRGQTLTRPTTDFFSHCLLSVAYSCPISAFITRPHYPSEFQFQTLLFETDADLQDATLLLRFYFGAGVLSKMVFIFQIPSQITQN